MDRSANDRLQPEKDPAVPACDEQAAPDLAASADPSLLTPVQRRVARLVQTLESDIIPRLVQAHRPPADPQPATAPASWPALEPLARMCYAADEGLLHATVLGLRQAGVPVERIYLELLAPAARELGRLWEHDLCDFTDVTVGVGRLQQLLRELSQAFGAEQDQPADGRRILLLPAPGEQHTLGASMAAEFFRRAGWDVVGGVGGMVLDPVELVQAEWFDILGLSAGNLARIDWLRDCITHARRVSRNHGLGVLVGGPLFVTQPDIGATLGCDFVVTDGQRGPEFAEALLASRSRRL